MPNLEPVKNFRLHHCEQVGGFGCNPDSLVLCEGHAHLGRNKEHHNLLHSQDWLHFPRDCQLQVGKEDWDDDEPRGLVLPRYLHDFDQLFEKDVANGSKSPLADTEMEREVEKVPIPCQVQVS